MATSYNYSHFKPNYVSRVYNYITVYMLDAEKDYPARVFGYFDNFTEIDTPASY